MSVREVFKPLVDLAFALKAQVESALTISLDEWGGHTGAEQSATPFQVCEDSPGRITRNGLGSLEVGAACDRLDE